MKRWLIAGALLFAASCGGKQRAVDAPSPESQRSLTPQEVTAAGKGVAEQYRQAYEVRSFDALAALYVQNLDLVVIHQGKAMSGWTAAETHLRALLARASEIHLKLEDVAVTALGPEAATVVASMRREVNDGTAAVIEQGQLTLAVRRSGDSWVIVTEHFSYAPR